MLLQTGQFKKAKQQYQLLADLPYRTAKRSVSRDSKLCLRVQLPDETSSIGNAVDQCSR